MADSTVVRCGEDRSTELPDELLAVAYSPNSRSFAADEPIRALAVYLHELCDESLWLHIRCDSWLIAG